MNNIRTIQSATALNNAIAGQGANATAEFYGAVGDGTTDDTAALQAAVATGKSISLRKDKTYLLSGPLNLSGQKLLGNGATIKVANQISTTTTTAITSGVTTQITVASATGFRVGQSITLLNASTFDTSNRVISAIVGNVITVSTTFGITVSGTTTVYLSFVPFTLASDAMVDDLKVDGNKANWTFYRWQNTSVVYTTGDRNVIRGMYANNVPGEGAIVGGNYNVVRDSVFTNLNGNGVHFTGAKHPVCDNVTVVIANLDTTVGHANGCIIWSNSITHATVVNCYTEGGITGVGSIDSNDNSDCTIIGNTIVNPTTNAMGISGSQVDPSRLVITGNRIYLNANTPVKISNTNGSPTVWPNQIIFKGNYIQGAASSAILLSLTRVKKVTVEGNHFDYGTLTTGEALVIASCDGVTVRNNTFTGGQYGFDVTSSPRLTIGGNHLYNQNVCAISMGDALNSAMIEGNFVYNDGTQAAGYNGIICRDRHIVRGNYIELTGGRSGVYPQPNSVVKDNTIRGGTAATIKVDASLGATGIVIKDNELTAASSIGSASTVTETGTVIVT